MNKTNTPAHFDALVIAACYAGILVGSVCEYYLLDYLGMPDGKRLLLVFNMILVYFAFCFGMHSAESTGYGAVHSRRGRRTAAGGRIYHKTDLRRPGHSRFVAQVVLGMWFSVQCVIGFFIGLSLLP